MANKRNKSRKQQRSRRPGSQVAPPAQPSAGVDAVTVTGSAAATGQAAARPQPPSSTSRYASAVSGPRRAGTVTATVGTINIDERVPYFAKDLRRIVVTAAVMVVGIVGASLLLH